MSATIKVKSLFILNYLLLCECSISHPAQFPLQGLSSQFSVAISSRVSCTAHFIPRRCISLFVEISESIWCPLKISVSDIANTKNPTAPTAIKIIVNNCDTNAMLKVKSAKLKVQALPYYGPY